MSERDPDTPFGAVAYAGISLASRYRRKAEFERMMRVVDHILENNPEAGGLIESIHCDSKGQNAYDVRCRALDGALDSADIHNVANAVECALRARGGHNGTIVSGGDIELSIDPWWYEGRPDPITYDLDSWMVAWSPRRGIILVGPHPDRIGGWSTGFENTNGCCSEAFRTGSVGERMIQLFALFHHVIVADGIEPRAAHREFCKIGEFRRWVSPDTLVT